MVEKPVDMFEYLPLPFDEELQIKEPGETMSAADFYNETQASGYLNTEWWKSN